MVFKELVTFRWLYLGRDPSKKKKSTDLQTEAEDDLTLETL